MLVDKLDRRIQFQRYSLIDNGFEEVEDWADHGDPIWASKTPLSDRERWSSQQQQAVSMARFEVRYSSFTADITPKDRILCEGKTYNIEGIKEIGRRKGYQITAIGKSD